VTSRLSFWLSYRLGFKPWDTGISPPELVEVIEGARRLAPGRALDLGCGTGTTTVYMATHGWDATGVDFVPQAIKVARSKAQRSGASVAFLVGDVTRLDRLGIQPGFDLLFDQGCFHSLPVGSRASYAAEVSRMARPGATYLLYAFGRRPDGMRRRSPLPTGLSPDEVRSLFEVFDLVEARPGTDPFNSHWYTLRRR
jgi:SAM-dependent methyltransferase